MTFRDWVIGWINWLRGADAAQEIRISTLERKVNLMADVLDTLKADFESYQALVTTTLGNLQAKIASLSAGALDPAKAEAIDAEVKAAIAQLTPPATPVTPATPPSDPAPVDPAPATDDADHVRKADQP
jgi:hypothetical protein